MKTSVYKNNIKLINSFFLMLTLLQILRTFLDKEIFIKYMDSYILFALDEILYVLFPSIILFFYTKKKNLNGKLNINEKLKLKSFSLIILIGILMYPISEFLYMLSSFFTLNTFKLDISKQNDLILQIICLALIPAICEEFTFRGILVKLFNEYSTFKVAIFTSLMFALLHMSFEQFLYAFITGFIMFIVVIISKNIISSIIIHFELNCISICAIYFNLKFFNQNIIVYFIISTFCLIFIYLLIRKLKSTYKLSKIFLKSNYKFNYYLSDSLMLAFSLCIISIILPMLLYFNIINKSNFKITFIIISLIIFSLLILCLLKIINFIISIKKEK